MSNVSINNISSSVLTKGSSNAKSKLPSTPEFIVAPLIPRRSIVSETKPRELNFQPKSVNNTPIDQSYDNSSSLLQSEEDVESV